MYEDEDPMGDANWQQTLSNRGWVSDDDVKSLATDRLSGRYRDGDIETPNDQAKRMLRDASPMAAATLIKLAQFSDVDSVRLRASCEILSRVDSQGASDDGREPWAGVFDASAVERFANEQKGE
jgi:hypothetical protein